MRPPCRPRRHRSCLWGASAGVPRGLRADRRQRPPRGSFPRAARARCPRSAELLAHRLGASDEDARVGLAEHALDVLGRHVGELAAPAHIFHVAALVLVERMEDRIFAPVELERLHAEALAHRVVERDGLLALVGAARMLCGEGAHRRVLAVDEISGLQILFHLSSFISLRTPWKSGPAWSARPSTTEKWFLPGIAMSPANAPRQRSPRSAFWRKNSLDSSPPTQVITGARVAGGTKAGERRSAVAASSRRSTFSQSTSTSGRRS